jgi:hypothetical protein
VAVRDQGRTAVARRKNRPVVVTDIGEAPPTGGASAVSSDVR